MVRALTDPGMERAQPVADTARWPSRLAARLGLAESVCEALAHAYERWDGKGYPDGLAGEEVPVAVRVVAVARDAELWARRAGLAGGGRGAGAPARPRLRPGGGRRRSSTAASEWLGRRRRRSVRRGARRRAGTGGDDRRGRARRGAGGGGRLHRPEVAVAPRSLDRVWPRWRPPPPGAAGLPDARRRRRSVGRRWCTTSGGSACPNGIWDRPGPLSADQWERVRLHPYLSERVLHRCTLLAPFADVAARHHERADGSGYHRGASGDQLDLGARLLAAADAYHAMTEDRPHRPALTPATPRRSCSTTSTPAASAGSRSTPCSPPPARPAARRRWPDPAGLTDREVEVLRLIARGQANKQVAATLGISRQDGGPPHRAHLRQGRGHHPGRGDPVRHGARPPVALSATEMGRTPDCPTGADRSTLDLRS